MVPTPKMMVSLKQGRAPEGDDGDDGHDAGEGEDDEGAGVEGGVGRPSLVARQQPERPADEHADGHRGKADDEGYPRAEDDPGQEVTAEVVGAQQVVDARGWR